MEVLLNKLIKICIFIFVISLFLGKEIYSQKIYLYGGYNFSQVYIDNLNIPQKMIKFDGYKPLHGFHIGSEVDLSIIKNISITSGLLLTHKGFNRIGIGTLFAQEGAYAYDYHNRINLFYFGIPISIKLKVYIKNDFNISFSSGIYTNYGFFGAFYNKRYYPEFDISIFEKYNINQTEIDRDFYNWWSDKKNSGNFKRFDFGLRFRFIFEKGSYQFATVYEIGLSDAASEESYLTIHKFRVLSFSLGYNLNNK